MHIWLPNRYQGILDCMVKKQIQVAASKTGTKAHIRTIEVELPDNMSASEVKKLIVAQSNIKSNQTRKEEAYKKLDKIGWDDVPVFVKEFLEYEIDYDREYENAANQVIRESGLSKVTDWLTYSSVTETIALTSTEADLEDVQSVSLPEDVLSKLESIKANPYYDKWNPNVFPLDEEGLYVVSGSPLFDKENAEGREAFKQFCLADVMRHDRHPHIAGWQDNPETFTLEDADNWVSTSPILGEPLDAEDFAELAKFDALAGGYMKELAEVGQGVRNFIDTRWKEQVNYIGTPEYYADEWEEDYTVYKVQERLDLTPSQIEEIEAIQVS